MNKINLSIDVGGTHTRLKSEVIKDENIIFCSQEFKQKINCRDKLKTFIQASITKIKPEFNITNCVIGFAGAVINHRKVEITNWKNKPMLTLEELISWGLPEKSTIMLNDMELAGYGILDMEEKNEMNSEWCMTLHKLEQPTANRLNNRLIIAPGTGFGTASIIEFSTPSGKKLYDVLSSEIQHIQIPPLNSRHAEIMDVLISKKPGRIFLNYEDFVSGKGLRDTYEAILELESMKPTDKNTAEIARSAITEDDKYAVEALNIFYSCVGRIMQAMTLMAQPYGGIYLCGASTIYNSKFIPHSDLIKEFHNCLIRQQLLLQFPVYLITKPDINILGGLWVCRYL